MMGEEHGNLSNDLRNEKIESKCYSESPNETENRKELNNHLGRCESAKPQPLRDHPLPFVAWLKRSINSKNAGDPQKGCLSEK